MAGRRPAVFIGSSTEGLNVAREIELQLQVAAETTIWKDGIFRLGFAALESLMSILDQFDFAIIVLSPDDTVETRGQSYASPRDNALFELGLFMGRLGRSRTFIVHAEGVDLKLPSDLVGVTASPYRYRDNLSAALSPTCTPIVKAIHALGFYEGRMTAKFRRATSDSIAALMPHVYRCPQSEIVAKEQGVFKKFASRSTSAKYLVLRGRDILSPGGEIALLSDHAGPLLKVQMLTVDFDSLGEETFDEMRENMDLTWEDLGTERQLAKDRLAFAKDLSKRNSGFHCRLLPINIVPEIKLRLYDYCGFFSFYRRRTGWESPVQRRPVFCVEDPDPSKNDTSPLRVTLDHWYDELWELAKDSL